MLWRWSFPLATYLRKSAAAKNYRYIRVATTAGWARVARKSPPEGLSRRAFNNLTKLRNPQNLKFRSATKNWY
jgi:hypothetical protein